MNKKTKGTKNKKELAIDSVLNMIRKLANNYSFRFKQASNVQSDLLEELISEGIVGALEAYDKYDSTRQVKFSSFAYFYIRSAMQKYISNFSGVCRQPRHNISMNYVGLPLDQEYFNEGGNSTIPNDLITLNESEARLCSDIEYVLDQMSGLTPCERNAICLHFKIETFDKHSESLPLRKLLVKTGLNKLKKHLKDLDNIK